MEKSDFNISPLERRISRREFTKFLIATIGSLLLKGDTKEKEKIEKIKKFVSELPPEYLHQEKLFKYPPETILYDLETLKQNLSKEGKEVEDEELGKLKEIITPQPSPTSIPTIEEPEPEETPTPEEEPITTQIIYRGPAGTKKVSITFDDTANPEILKTLLRLSEKHNIKIVWFIIGRTMNSEAADLIQAGMESGLIRIGNHSQNHDIFEFSKLNKNYIEREKNEWLETMQSYGFSGEHLKFYFRPPGGAGGYQGGDEGLLEVLSKNRYKYLVMWDVEFIYTTRVKGIKYTAENLQEIARSQIIKTQGGNLVLAHFNPIDTEAIINLIQELIPEGYEFVYPEELL